MTNRYVLKTDDLENGRILDALDRSQGALSALNWMLYTSLEEGGMEQHASGVFTLFEQQVAILAAIQDSVSDLVDERADLKAALGTPEGVPEEEWSADMQRLREQMVAEKIKAGFKPNMIATAMNMNHSRLEKVMRQLEGGAAKRGRDASPASGRAVNQ